MIGILLIGAGTMVEEYYCPTLRRLEKSGAVRVFGVVDPSESRAARIAGRFDKARTYRDCAAAFGTDSYDLAIIVSPPGFHADHACAALDHGCHVLCEKPMATTTSDANRMNAAAEKADRVLGVAFARRFLPNFADVAKLVAEGALGDELRFAYRDGGTYSWPVATGSAFQREESRGGALLDKGVHLLDQLSCIFGDAQVERAFDDSLVGGVETNSKLELVYPKARGVMHVSWEYPLNNGLRIWGSAGEVVIAGEDIRTYRHRGREGWMLMPATTDWPADMLRKGGKRVRPSNPYASFELQLIAMLRCVAYGEPFPVTGVQAARIQATIDTAYELAEPLACPWLSETEQVSARAMHWKAAQTA